MLVQIHGHEAPDVVVHNGHYSRTWSRLRPHYTPLNRGADPSRCMEVACAIVPLQVQHDSSNVIDAVFQPFPSCMVHVGWLYANLGTVNPSRTKDCVTTFSPRVLRLLQERETNFPYLMLSASLTLTDHSYFRRCYGDHTAVSPAVCTRKMASNTCLKVEFLMRDWARRAIRLVWSIYPCINTRWPLSQPHYSP